jgi:hypothetical protein
LDEAIGRGEESARQPDRLEVVVLARRDAALVELVDAGFGAGQQDGRVRGDDELRAGASRPERAEERERALKRTRDHQKEMILGSMGISVPLLAIAAVFTGLPGVVAVCVALAVIAIVSSR